MGVYPIGDQRVGVELSVPVLDDDDQPTYTDFGEPITESIVVWVDNACFEIQTPTETQNLTVTTSEIAWVLLPVVDSIVPALAIVEVDDEPAEVAAPIPVFIVDEESDRFGKPTISSSDWLLHNGLRYAMRGDAVLEQDIRGRQDHVFCVCEREQG